MAVYARYKFTMNLEIPASKEGHRELFEMFCRGKYPDPITHPKANWNSNGREGAEDNQTF